MPHHSINTWLTEACDLNDTALVVFSNVSRSIQCLLKRLLSFAYFYTSERCK